jgi:cobalt-zinc-cadmium efflux system membrane fusion protein
VRALTPTLNGETRTATALLEAADPALLPGRALRVRLMPAHAPASAALVLPEEAVQSVDGRDVVFVRMRDGFRAVAVRTGRRSAGRIEIVSGLAPGLTIATVNAFLLKAERGKAAGGEH